MGIDCESEANHDLILLLDKPGPLASTLHIEQTPIRVSRARAVMRHGKTATSLLLSWGGPKRSTGNGLQEAAISRIALSGQGVHLVMDSEP